MRAPGCSPDSSSAPRRFLKSQGLLSCLKKEKEILLPCAHCLLGLPVHQPPARSAKIYRRFFGSFRSSRILSDTGARESWLGSPRRCPPFQSLSPLLASDRLLGGTLADPSCWGPGSPYPPLLEPVRWGPEKGAPPTRPSTGLSPCVQGWAFRGPWRGAFGKPGLRSCCLADLPCPLWASASQATK